MKFSLAFLSTVVAITSASKSNLRTSTANHFVFADASVSIVGLKTEPTAEDMEVIGESLMSAYNELLASPDMHALAFEPKTGAVIASEVSGLTGCPKCAPDDDSFMVAAGDKAVTSAMVVGRFSLGGCPKCAPDDDEAVLAKKIAGCPKCAPDDDLAISIEEAFNARVCHKLRTSVSDNFSLVHDCAVSMESNADSFKTSVYGMILAKAVSA